MTNERDEEVVRAISSMNVPPRKEGFFEDLAKEMNKSTSPRRRPGPSRRVFASIGSVAAVAAALVIFVSVNPGDSVRKDNNIAQPPTATSFAPQLASQVIERASSTLANVKSLAGNVNFVQYPYRFAGDESDNPGYTVDGTFKLTSSGNFRFDAQKGDNDWNGPTMSAYSVNNATFTRCDQEPSGKWGCTSFTGLTAIDSGANPQLWNLDSLLSSLRASASSNDSALETVTYDGRPAWKVSATFGDRPNGGAEAATIYVDQATAFPVAAETTRDGKAYTSIKITNLQQDVAAADSDFVITPPAGAFINNPDVGAYKRVSLDGVKAVTGYAPFVPSYVPEGFKQAEVSVAAVGEESGYGGAGVVNNVNRNVYVITYRRGIESFTITTRSALGLTNWIDPLGSYGEQVLSTSAATLKGGAFDGLAVTATETDRDVRIWGFNRDYVLTVSGDLSTSVAMGVANSIDQ